MTEAAVSIELEGGIATVTLSNPPVNALSHASARGSPRPSPGSRPTRT
jgi:enoyl-CoA hydratase/carnithine racemase